LLVFFPHALLTMHGHRNIKLESYSRNEGRDMGGGTFINQN